MHTTMWTLLLHNHEACQDLLTITSGVSVCHCGKKTFEMACFICWLWTDFVSATKSQLCKMQRPNFTGVLADIRMKGAGGYRHFTPLALIHGPGNTFRVQVPKKSAKFWRHFWSVSRCLYSSIEVFFQLIQMLANEILDSWRKSALLLPFHGTIT